MPRRMALNTARGKSKGKSDIAIAIAMASLTRRGLTMLGPLPMIGQADSTSYNDVSLKSPPRFRMIEKFLALTDDSKC